MKLKLIERHDEGNDVLTVRFEVPPTVTWEAGQYAHWTLDHANPDEKGIKRFFTISSAPYEGIWQITTRISQSTFKQALKNLSIGDSIEATDPEGDFTWQDTGKPVVMIAGGIGATPFHSMLKQRVHDSEPIDLHLIYANRTEDIVFKSEFVAWQAKHPELIIDFPIGQPLTVESITAAAPDINKSLVYLSGPEPMVDSLGQSLTSVGLAKEQLKQDWFPGYTEKTY